MTRSLAAIFENGVLRPLEPLGLKDHQRVTVTITDSLADAIEPWLDHAYLAGLEHQEGPEPTLAEVRKALSGSSGNLSDEVRAEREDR